MERKIEKKWLSWIGNFLFYSATLFLISFSVFYLLNKDEDSSLFGYRVYHVKTNSMAPVREKRGGFLAGDLIFVKKTNYSSLEVGDIISYQLTGKNQLTHRIIQKMDVLNNVQGEFLVTQGDANNTADAPIPYEKVLGKVILVIPKVGWLIFFVQQHPILCLGILSLSILIFFLWNSYQKKKNEARRKERKSIGKSRKKAVKGALSKEKKKRRQGKGKQNTKKANRDNRTKQKEDSRTNQKQAKTKETPTRNRPKKER